MLSISHLFEVYSKQKLQPQSKRDLKDIGKAALWGAAFGGPAIRVANAMFDPDDEPLSLKKYAASATGGALTGAGATGFHIGRRRARQMSRRAKA